MVSLCPVDGETLSRFRDGELPPDLDRKIAAHVPTCLVCEARLGRYDLADAVVSRVPIAPASRTRNRLAASLSVAAALVASVATNVLLTPKTRPLQPPPLRLSAAPSETLSSFYEKVAPPRGQP